MAQTHTITETLSRALTEQGHDVLYRDSDSVFVALPPPSPATPRVSPSPLETPLTTVEYPYIAKDRRGELTTPTEQERIAIEAVIPSMLEFCFFSYTGGVIPCRGRAVRIDTARRTISYTMPTIPVNGVPSEEVTRREIRRVASHAVPLVMRGGILRAQV